jgi:hypothetical protein
MLSTVVNGKSQNPLKSFENQILEKKQGHEQGSINPLFQIE